MQFKISWKFHAKAYLLVFFIFILLFNTILASVNNFIERIFDAHQSILYVVLALTFIVFILTITHELIHAAAISMFEGKVKIEYKILYMDTLETSHKPFTKVQFIIIMLLPVTVISLLSLIIPSWLGNLIYVLNLIGSSGDIIMAFELCKYKYDSRFIDQEYGFDVIR